MSRRAKLVVLGLLFALCGASAVVQSVRQNHRKSLRPAELYNVVWQQVAAFRTDDYASAYRQVSAEFQERFNIEAFTDLARSDLRALCLAERVEFGAVRWDGRHAIVTAYFFLPGGEVLPCIYRLAREERGWKIDAVRVQKRWPAGRRLSGMRA